MRRMLRAGVLLYVSVSFSLWAQQANQPLDNAQVISMTKAGLGEQTILVAIQKARSTAFDTSPQALVALKNAGVSDAVINAILASGDKRQVQQDDATNGSAKVANQDSEVHRKAASATKQVSAPVGNFTLWFDPAKWTMRKDAAKGELTFTNNGRNLYARMITEGIGIPKETLPGVALINAQQVDPNAKLVSQQKRMVNGHEVLVLQMDVTSAQIPFRFYGYYYGGTSGTIQLVTYTTPQLFERNYAALTDFLDGLVISDQPLPPPPPGSGNGGAGGTAVLPVNDKAEVRYDRAKWREAKSGEPGRFRFRHLKGDAYALIIAERIAVDPDALPEIAIHNARKADPDAHITLKEKRTVNGVDVCFLKFEAVVSGVPLTYYGYYYAGGAGTIQILTYTGQSLVQEYEADMLEFLNGFHVNP